MAECPMCGAVNPSYAVYCGRCGQELPEEFKKRASQEPTASDARLPGPPLDFSGPVRRVSPPVRPSGERLDVPRAVLKPASSIWEGNESRRRELDPNPWIGGTCAIVAGFLGIIQGIVAVAGGTLVIHYSIAFSGLQVLLGFVAIAFGFLAVLGGLDARLRKKYKQSLIRVILGMVAYGFGIGALLGLVAVILIALSQDEFDEVRY
jgi:hypothetical protein